MRYESPGKLVGNTPMVNIGHIGQATIWAKLEGSNPTGSLKDRTAAALVKQSLMYHNERARLLDASSGSFACALAYFARLHKKQCTLVVNSKISDDNLAFLRTQGAEIIKHGTVTGESRDYCLNLVQQNPTRWIFTDQLTNPLAPHVHENTTAPEILSDCPTLTAVFGSKGSGATLLGVSRYMATAKPSVQIFGSVGIPGDEKKIAGTYVEGDDFVSPFIEKLASAKNYTADISVRYSDAMEQCQSLPVLVGPQGGGVFEAAKTAIAEYDLVGDIVLIFGDSMLKNVSRFTTNQQAS